MSSNSHKSSAFKKVIRQLRKAGITIVETKKGAFLRHDNASDQLLIHYGEKAINPIRRWANKNNIKVKL